MTIIKRNSLFCTLLVTSIILTACDNKNAPNDAADASVPAIEQSAHNKLETLPLPKRLAFMSGHVEAGLALYRAGKPEMGAKHLLHPVSETHATERVGLDALGFDASLFEAVSTALERGLPASEIETQLLAAEENLASVAAQAGGDTLEIIDYLMETVLDEYAIGVTDDLVTDAGEYQDAYGFTVVGIKRAKTIKPQPLALISSLEALLALWPEAPIPPENPATLSQIQTQVEAVRGELNKLAMPASDEINVYSARKEALIKPLFDRFTEQTGINVNLVTSKGDALLTRLEAEGAKSPADVLITVDVGRLHRAQQAGVLQAVEIPDINAVIADRYRDSAGYWYGLSLRSRVLIYSPERVKENELSSYEALADDNWQSRICIRSSGNIYNQSLIASFIAHSGIESTDAWLKRFVDNFARHPRGGDRDQIKAVAAGLCDVAVVNSYYLGAMLNSSNAQEAKAAEQVKLFWPNQAGRGTHMNISGVGITKAAPNKANAVALIKFLASEESQKWYAEANNEYPVVGGVDISATLTSWGKFKADTLAVEKLGELNAEAVKAMDRAGWK